MIGPGYSVERTTSDEDLDRVAALEAECFTNPWTRVMLEREIKGSATARVYVLRLHDRGVAAFCTCWLIVDELHINTIAVDPAVRRAGLATALMQHVHAGCRAIRGAARDARSPRLERAGPPAVCASSGSWKPPCGRSTTRNRKRTPSSSGTGNWPTDNGRP